MEFDVDPEVLARVELRRQRAAREDMLHDQEQCSIRERDIEWKLVDDRRKDIEWLAELRVDVDQQFIEQLDADRRDREHCEAHRVAAESEFRNQRHTEKQETRERERSRQQRLKRWREYEAAERQRLQEDQMKIEKKTQTEELQQHRAQRERARKARERAEERAWEIEEEDRKRQLNKELARERRQVEQRTMETRIRAKLQRHEKVRKRILLQEYKEKKWIDEFKALQEAKGPSSKKSSPGAEARKAFEKQQGRWRQWERFEDGRELRARRAREASQRAAWERRVEAEMATRLQFDRQHYHHHRSRYDGRITDNQGGGGQLGEETGRPDDVRGPHRRPRRRRLATSTTTKPPWAYVGPHAGIHDPDSDEEEGPPAKRVRSVPPPSRAPFTLVTPRDGPSKPPTRVSSVVPGRSQSFPPRGGRQWVDDDRPRPRPVWAGPKGRGSGGGGDLKRSPTHEAVCTLAQRLINENRKKTSKGMGLEQSSASSGSSRRGSPSSHLTPSPRRQVSKLSSSAPSGWSTQVMLSPEANQQCVAWVASHARDAPGWDLLLVDKEDSASLDESDSTRQALAFTSPPTLGKGVAPRVPTPPSLLRRWHRDGSPRGGLGEAASTSLVGEEWWITSH